MAQPQGPPRAPGVCIGKPGPLTPPSAGTSRRLGAAFASRPERSRTSTWRSWTGSWLAGGVMAAPPRAKREAMRWGGEYRRKGDWDWFDALSRHEQAHVREGGWFAQEGRGESPDEIAQRISLKDWLEHTRALDATRALRTGAE